MATIVQQPRQVEVKRWYNDWELFRYHFIRSNYITALWNWFMTLAGKASEPVLFASVLYSGYQLVPGAPEPSVGVSIGAFIIQNAALDVGGMGLLKMTKDAKKGEMLFPKSVGYVLIGLMIVNMIAAAVKRFFPLPGQIMAVTEAVLLILRSVMAVLFGHAIHSLKDEEVVIGSTEVVKAVDMNQLFEQISGQVNQLAFQLQTVQSQVHSVVHSTVKEVVHSTVHEVVQSQTSQVIEEVHSLVHPQLQEVSSAVQQLPMLVQQEVNYAVQENVQSLLNEQVQTMVQELGTGDYTSAIKQLEERMQEVTSSVKDMRTTITEVRTVSQVTSAPKPIRSGSQVRAFEPPKPVQSLPASVESEPDDEPVGDRVRRFISDQIELGRKPSLSEIMNQCKCSKNTAIKCRRELLPEESEPSTEPVSIV